LQSGSIYTAQMEGLESVQNEIADKLEHGFDTRHIYQMFSTFVDTIKNQSHQIHDMQEQAERSELLIENMAHTIQTMEMNIQGFVTLPPLDDDDGSTLIASRRSSIASRRPSVQPHVLQPTNLIENAVNSLPKSSTSASPSPRVHPNEWEDSPDKKQVHVTEGISGTGVLEDKDSSSSVSRPAIPPEKEQSQSHTREKDASKGHKHAKKGHVRKFKKRRILRHLSFKLKEERAEEVAAENEESDMGNSHTATDQETIPEKQTVQKNENVPDHETAQSDHSDPVKVKDVVTDQEEAAQDQGGHQSRSSVSRGASGDNSAVVAKDGAGRPPRSKRTSREGDPALEDHASARIEVHEKPPTAPTSKRPSVSRTPPTHGAGTPPAHRSGQ
jgi:hypothetical protein